MSIRPPLFADMGDAFATAFGNAEAIFTIDGVNTPPTRIILRVGVGTNEVEEHGQGVEAVNYSLCVPASSVPGLTSQRDSMIYNGTTYPIINHIDDAHAMLRLFVEGDLA